MNAFSMVILTSLFWLGVSGIFYTYVLYPLILKAGAAFCSERAPPALCSEQDPPTVSIIFAAHNEAKVISEKLNSLIASNFPADRLEILIGDDSSTDGTGLIIAAFTERHPHIRLTTFPRRSGKPAIVNELVATATGAVLILTDANIIFEPDTVSRLATWFIDPKVGLVAANILTRHLDGAGIALQEDAYIRREIAIKHQQSVLSGVVIAPFGACYAIRRCDYRPVPPGHTVDDFYIAMHPLVIGRTGVQDMAAICSEDASHSASSEFRRKARISRGNFQNLFAFIDVALCPWSRLGFHFLSHKVVRWLTPAMLVCCIFTCAALAYRSGLYRVPLALMVLLALSPALDWSLNRLGRRVRIVRFASYFLMMNLALGYGFLLWIGGRRESFWQTIRSE